MKKILLYSGGLDSWLIDKLWEPNEKIYIDMDTNYSEAEKSRLPKDVKVVSLPLGQWEHKEDAYIPLRNMFLYMIASMEEGEELDICLGAVKGERVWDKRIEFIKLLEPVLNYLYQEVTNSHVKQKKKVIHLNMWGRQFDKATLIKMYLNRGGTISEILSETFSCHYPIENKQCWNCQACFRTYCNLVINGWKPKEEITKKICRYIDNHVVPHPEKVIGKEDETTVILNVIRPLGYERKGDKIVKISK